MRARVRAYVDVDVDVDGDASSDGAVSTVTGGAASYTGSST